MTRQSVSDALKNELARLNGDGAVSNLSDDDLLSQLINSSGFLQLLIGVEGTLGITIEDEDFYEAAPVTVGELVDFLTAQTAKQESA